MTQIRKLDTNNHSDVKKWVNLPYHLYAGDPLWVPQMMDEAKGQLDRKKYPFYLHSFADFFVAEQDGKVVGRLAVMENTRYNKIRNAKTAIFSHFESVEDYAVAEALFTAGFEWARSRGLDKMVGPKGFLPADGMGMLIEGFMRRPAIGIAYNPPFYYDFIKRLGFEKETDFMSGYVPGTFQVPERIERIAAKVKERYNFEVRSYTSKKELHAIVPTVIEVYNSTFVNNWEFVPITLEEAKVIESRLLDIIDPTLIRLVWKGDDLAGFILIYPDISAAIQRTSGKLWPFGFITLLREFKKTEWINVNGAGILPQYQGRGVDAMLYVELAAAVRASGYAHAEIVQVDEANERMQAEVSALGVTFDKRHRIFRREL
ncbi:MAG: hypothetical protein J5I90_15990 [Caldilineales bacterium]|nr:hypothetical protein [Caldilineales bacterium]